jgi:diaminohydroxyphosphoribosylaminopyrimidine deaminase/5-amino-6-(5-phosphoribosylamino)uracil reductase
MDPAPHTDGRGVGRLRAAGVEVLIGEGHAEARHLVEAFAKHITTGMPFVTVKFAMSLDGKIATASGMSRWISNETSRREAHRLRAESDAVMVGIGTVIADDPRLTVRDVPIKGHRLPLRVVVDSTGRLPVDAAMLSEPGDTVVAVADSSAAIGLRARSVEHLVVGAGDDRVDLTRLLAALGARGAMAVLVEGGGTLHGALLDQGIVDKVVIFVAPIIIGGEGAPGPVGGVGAASIADALRVEIVESRDMDGDIMLIGYPKK